MKISILFTLLLIILSIGSCKKDHEGSLTLHFKAEYDGQQLPMAITKPFTFPDQLQFLHVSFLMSDLALVDGLGSVELKEIELVDMSFNDVNSAEEGYIIHLDKLPARTFTGLRFGIGVPQDLNDERPSDFASSHPLSKSSYYWEAWNSYIFMKTEGRIDTVGNNAFDTGFAYHTGTDQLYMIVEWTVPITIEEGKNKEIDIVIDYEDLLQGIDIKSDPQNHNPQDSVQIGLLVQNIPNAITLIQ